MATGLLLMMVILAEGWLLRLALAPLLLLSSACTGFIFWRLSRIIRAFTIRGDRGYDQKTKFILPPEYAQSESVLAASRRRRRSRRR